MAPAWVGSFRQPPVIQSDPTLEDSHLADTTLRQSEQETLGSVAASSPVTRGGLAPHKLQKVLTYIEEKLAEPVGVRELAAQVHMSPFHFARRFKQASECRRMAYITHVRIERAKALVGIEPAPGRGRDAGGLSHPGPFHGGFPPLFGHDTAGLSSRVAQGKYYRAPL
jgi:hypothetical protein